MTQRVYHGTAGHFIGAERCCFRLHTSVGKFRVSTVGCYHPLHSHDVAVEIGHGRMYETYVFDLGEDGEPVAWQEIDSAGYNDAAAAAAGHEAMVRKYENREPTGS